MTPFRISLLSFALAGLVALPAAAQQTGEVGEDHAGDVEAEESPGDGERAQEHFDAGAKSYYEGDYGQAAVEFRRAHEIHPHPLFLYNFALATRKLGQLEEAGNAAREADRMEAALPPEQDARNRALIHGTGLVGNARDIVADINAESGDPSPSPEADEGGDGNSDDSDEPTEVSAPPATDGTSGFGSTGWIGTGSLTLGVGGLVAASIVHYDLHIHREELEQRRGLYPDSEAVPELEDRVATRERLRNTLFLSGVGLLGVGAGLLVWETRSPSGADEAVGSLMMTPTGFGLSVQW